MLHFCNCSWSGQVVYIYMLTWIIYQTQHSSSPSRVLARILDLGRVSNDQGVNLNSQIYSPTTDNACGCSMLCNQIQGEHTLIYSTVTLEY